MITELPKKWAIRCTPESSNFINKFYQDHLKEYQGCKKEFPVVEDAYLHYPQHTSACHSRMNGPAENYTVISFLEFCTFVLNHSDEPQLFN